VKVIVYPGLVGAKWRRQHSTLRLGRSLNVDPDRLTRPSYTRLATLALPTGIGSYPVDTGIRGTRERSRDGRGIPL
jgi:hypothetical protein